MRDSNQPGHYMSLSDYLVWEEKNVIKHEYVGGVAYAMSGVTKRHNLITLNIATALRQPARRRGCQVFATEVKLRSPVDRMYYPDLFVACGRATDFEFIAEKPSVIVEVLSRRTRRTDQTEKLESYTRIESLRAYLLVGQGRRFVILHSRDLDGGWNRTEIMGDGAVPLECLDTLLALDHIYEDVSLPPLTVGEEDDDGDD